MGHYHLKTYIFVVDIGGCDIVLGVESLRTLRSVTMEFKELYIKFLKDSRTQSLKGIQAGPPEVIRSHNMEKLLKRGHSSIIAQLHTVQAMEAIPPSLPPTLQQVLDNHSSVFEIPKGLPPSRGEQDHNILLLLGSQPPNVQP